MESSLEARDVAGALSAAQRRLKAAASRPERQVDDWFEEDPEPAGPAPAPVEFDLNSAGFDELRAGGLSVTQAKRLLAHRERSGGFDAVDELDAIPGFPRDFLAELKQRATL